MRARTPLALLITLFASASWSGCGEPARSPDAGELPGDAGRPRDASPADEDAAAEDAGGAQEDGGMAGTDGCGRPADIATGEWVGRSVDVGGSDREFFVWLPDGYDPDRAYPVVYQFHGCSDSATREDNNVPVQTQSGGDAIHVRGRAAGRCWEDVDVAYFDALVPEVEATWCADPERRFATGYSSGAFMVHRLACSHGDVLRAVASIAGGQGGGSCTGEVAALLIHDANDGTVGISASEAARDAHAARNGCDTAAARTPIDPSPCEQYGGCDEGLPVVWCRTTGRDHARQDALAAPAFWSFLSSF